jgi:hypothetical protein
VLATKPYVDSIVNSSCVDDITYTFKTNPGKLSYLSLNPCFKFSSLNPKYAISHSDASQLRSDAFKINDTTGIVQISTEIEYSGKYLLKISAKD